MPHDTPSCSPAQRGTPVAALGLDARERAVLDILRHYCVSFAAPAREGWVTAIRAALDAFGEARGPHVAVAALAALQVLRRTRASGFRFNTPDCPDCAGFVTGHERLLIAALRAAAAGRDEAARAHADLLCEGNGGGRVAAALSVLAETARIRAPAPLSDPA